MDFKEINWLLSEKYGLMGVEDNPGKWPAEVFQDLKKLKEGEPLAYLIGFVPFLNLKIDLALRPLIPRSETEYWVEKLISFYRDKEKPKRCLDVFAGSGCIGLSLLYYWPESRIDFSDIDSKCLDQVKINLDLNKIDQNRAGFICSDVFDSISGNYDLILANPPYIDSADISRLPSSVKDYEPNKALLAENHGMSFIVQFLNSVKDHLRPQGCFWMEFDSKQKEMVEDIVRGRFKYEFNRDQYGQWRFLVGSA